MLHFPRLVLSFAAAVILVLSGCGSGSDYIPPDNPDLPTLTVTATGATITGSVSRVGSGGQAGSLATLVTVKDVSVGSTGSRIPADIKDLAWSFTVSRTQENQILQVEYWLDNRLIESQLVTVTW